MSISRLPPYDRARDAYFAVIEAVKGSRNKFKFDPHHGLFVHDGVLPTGASYPFDFGFIPGTKAEDGDPVDVLLLIDEPAFVGAVVPCRLVGAIEAEQREGDEEPVRNDRLLAVACKSRAYRDVRELADLPATVVEEVEHFWVSYNEIRRRSFCPIGRADAAAAEALVRRGKRASKGRAR